MGDDFVLDFFGRRVPTRPMYSGTGARLYRVPLSTSFFVIRLFSSLLSLPSPPPSQKHRQHGRRTQALYPQDWYDPRRWRGSRGPPRKSCCVLCPTIGSDPGCGRGGCHVMLFLLLTAHRPPSVSSRPSARRSPSPSLFPSLLAGRSSPRTARLSPTRLSGELSRVCDGGRAWAGEDAPASLDGRALWHHTGFLSCGTG